MRLLDVDLRDGLPDGVDGVAPVRLLLRWGPRPLGVVTLAALPVPAVRLARLVADAVAPAAGDLLHPGGPFRAALPDDPALPAATRPDGPVLPVGSALAPLLAPPLLEVPEPAAVAEVAVVVCTRDRPASLDRCLAALGRLTLAPAELVVVDNGNDPATRAVAERHGARWVREPQPGLSRARNTGIAATTAPLVAFTDDDVEVAPTWLAALAQACSEPDVLSVTGPVLPAALDAPAQELFEDSLGGLGSTLHARDFDRAWLLRHLRRPPNVWQVGAGANVLFRRAAFDRVGLFDVDLGAGAAGCSEDSELWHRLLAGGWRCRYTPAAVVFHHHRDDVPALQDQARAYMRGHVAALGAQWRRTRSLGEPRRVALTLPRYYAARLAQRAVWGQGDPTLRAEVAGWAQGLPLAVRLAGRRAAHAEQPGDRAAREEFLARNPFPHRRTLGSFYGEKMAAIHRVAPASGVRTVVEVGGGQSGLAAALYPSARVLTVDLEQAYGRRRDLYGAPGRDFAVADAVRLPLRDASVDVVTFFDVLEHVPDHAGAVAEALRVVRPGGCVLVTTPSDTWRFPAYRSFAPFCPTDADVMAEWGHVRRGYAIGELDALFGRAHDAFASFLGPVSVLAHDVAFSRLPERAKRAAGLLLAPLTVPAARWHTATGPGTELAARWTV